jgi:4'-phosphopantetheinyl transferase
MIAGCPFQLSERAIHVWALDLQPCDSLAAHFEPVLSRDEMERARRFRFDRLRYAFVITRGALRHLLGRYLNVTPAGIRFDYGSKGKPAVLSAAGIEFNLADSGDLAAFAFTVGCPVGIDLEQVHPLDHAPEIASRFFCAEESAEILSLPPGEREAAFFRCWTRKEAYLKAIGDGLSAPLDQFRVTVQPNQPARFLHIGHDPQAAEAWTLDDLSLAPNYAAALAYRDRPRAVSIFAIADPRELHPR